MILVDRQIRKLCQGIVPEDIQAFYSNILGINLPETIKPMVEPFDPELVNPPSLDIRIGETAEFRNHHTHARTGETKPSYKHINLAYFDEILPYWMQPGDRLLVASLETFAVPDFVEAKFFLKSSRGREWYEHLHTGWCEHLHAGLCDPGWHGSKLTMELINMDLAPLPIYPGLKIGQLEFSLTFGLPERSYAVTGRYNGDRQVSQSKG